MAYFVMEGTRYETVMSKEEFMPLLHGHKALMADGVARGVILLAGPRTDDADGGIVVLKAKDRAEAEAFFDADPFKINNLQGYRFMEIEIPEYNECLKDWLK